MGLDFTVITYKRLLNTLRNQGFSFQPFGEFVLNPAENGLVLRHDVDALPGNSLEFARIQEKMGIRGTYYFRAVPRSFDEKIIKEIHSQGHEVGYHYEDLGATADRRKAEGGRRKDFSKKYVVCSKEYEEFEKQLVNIAIESFAENLERLRKLAPVSTICMHGSPMNRWDSRLLWKYYDYHDFGIVGEPYFDINFDDVLYITDTGRRWDGGSVSIRDKASGVGRQASGRKEGERERGGEGEVHSMYSNWKVKPIKFRDDFKEPATSNQQPATLPEFHSTFDIIRAAEQSKLPHKMMMTFHPQRWTDSPAPWLKELVWQNVKNVVKYFIVRRKAGGSRK